MHEGFGGAGLVWLVLESLVGDGNYGFRFNFGSHGAPLFSLL